MPAGSALETLYYISKGQKTVGPCTLDDLQSYIAYGSVRDSDLVRRQGMSGWTPLRSLAELQTANADPATSRDITTRQRTARLRDYSKVPAGRRGSVVLRRLVLGFFLFPPLLWRGAASVFRDRVYSARTDEKGYLLYWPRWTEILVATVLVLNCLVWAVFAGWLWNGATPMLREVVAVLTTGIADLQTWLGN